ncbi:MAG: hypothetical protein MUC98_12335 [Desulfobacterota bacterium]|jgi:hypothetical protein|nr:hypothetical protein [Thermodesulfobacteriota bacterium]
MASNFRVVVWREGESVHLKLVGDFDGSSACELLETVKDHSVGGHRVLICTNSLKKVHPFGVHVFEKKLGEMKHSPFRIFFTGAHAKKIAPRETMCL